MKTSTKVTIGLSIAAVAGISTAVVISDKVVNKIRFSCNRHKAKKFVDDKFNGNEKLLDIVDGLTDKDLDTLFGVVKKVKDGSHKASAYGNQVSDNLKDATKTAKGKLTSFIDTVF
jgi:gas vesicle protein